MNEAAALSTSDMSLLAIDHQIDQIPCALPFERNDFVFLSLSLFCDKIRFVISLQPSLDPLSSWLIIGGGRRVTLVHKLCSTFLPSHLFSSACSGMSCQNSCCTVSYHFSYHMPPSLMCAQHFPGLQVCNRTSAITLSNQRTGEARL